MSAASKPHSEHVVVIRNALNYLASYGVDAQRQAGPADAALDGLVEQFETAQNAMKEALAALMVGQPDRPRALHNAERILRAALAKRLEIETSHEPSQMDWPEGTPHVL